MEEMWNGCRITHEIRERGCATESDQGKEVAKLSTFSPELGRRDSVSSTSSLPCKLTGTCKASEKGMMLCYFHHVQPPRETNELIDFLGNSHLSSTKAGWG